MWNPAACRCTHPRRGRTLVAALPGRVNLCLWHSAGKAAVKRGALEARWLEGHLHLVSFDAAPGGSFGWRSFQLLRRRTGHQVRLEHYGWCLRSRRCRSGHLSRWHRVDVWWLLSSQTVAPLSVALNEGLAPLLHDHRDLVVQLVHLVGICCWSLSGHLHQLLEQFLHCWVSMPRHATQAEDGLAARILLLRLLLHLGFLHMGAGDGIQLFGSLVAESFQHLHGFGGVGIAFGFSTLQGIEQALSLLEDVPGLNLGRDLRAARASSRATVALDAPGLLLCFDQLLQGTTVRVQGFLNRFEACLCTRFLVLGHLMHQAVACDTLGFGGEPAGSLHFLLDLLQRRTAAFVHLDDLFPSLHLLPLLLCFSPGQGLTTASCCHLALRGKSLQCHSISQSTKAFRRGRLGDLRLSVGLLRGILPPDQPLPLPLQLLVELQGSAGSQG
mmetsp:Transcript_91147/g.217416  ORF Transcript_91147/g.217416 Transcript_91147/m.217416 type:complete len:442 (+) Transcript_91147:684-2009(+)